MWRSSGSKLNSLWVSELLALSVSITLSSSLPSSGSLCQSTKWYKLVLVACNQDLVMIHVCVPKVMTRTLTEQLTTALYYCRLGLQSVYPSPVFVYFSCLFYVWCLNSCTWGRDWSYFAFIWFRTTVHRRMCWTDHGQITRTLMKLIEKTVKIKRK